MTNLSSQNAVALMLTAETELFDRLAKVVADVRDKGQWRENASNTEKDEVMAWLDHNWREGFEDDKQLVSNWRTALNANPVALHNAVTTEQDVVTALIAASKVGIAKLSDDLSIQTHESWMRDLNDELNAKEQILRFL